MKHFKDMLASDDVKNMHSLFYCFKKVTKGTPAQGAFEMGGGSKLQERNLTYRMVEAAIMEIRAYYPVI